jgi:hypothetical protein
MENTSYPLIAHFPPEKLFPAPKGCGKYSAGIGHYFRKSNAVFFFGFKFPPENNFPAPFPPSKREIKRQFFVFPNGPQIPAENQNSGGKQKKQTAPYCVVGSSWIVFFFYKTRVGMMGNLISQSFQHQIN